MNFVTVAFYKLDSGFLDHPEHADLQDGSTCLVAFIRKGILTVASLGDSICTLVRKDTTY